MVPWFFDSTASLIQTLKRRTARRSAKREHDTMPEQTPLAKAEAFIKAAARLRAHTPRQTTDSADLIRQDRARDEADPPG
jgi:hypothetical protein